ncbi:TPA: hypothetical protein ACH3X2_006134 [Trebouxia sp. C0005]
MIFVERLPLHRPTRCATRQGLKCVSLRSPAPLAHVHGQHGNKIHMDRSAKLRNFTCSAAPDISKEAPARGRDFDYGMFATSEPAQTSDASPQDTSWIRPVWDALKPASAAAIGVVARAIGGKGVLLALSCAVEHYTMAVGLAGIYVALLTGSGAFTCAAAAIPGALYICCALFSLWKVTLPMVTIDVGYPYLQGRIAVSAAAWDFAKCNTLLINLLDGLATYSSACDAFKTSMKVPQLFTFMSPGRAATDNDTGAKHAWQALVLLFLGVAAQALNREVRAKGVCLAAMTLLKFGKPVWVWVGLCVALATWHKERWNSGFGSAAVAAVICSMYMLTMHFVTSAAYWNECLWREVRISNSVFQGVVRVLESSAEVLSRETARGGIESVGILLTWGSRLLLLTSLATLFRAVLPRDTMKKAIKATQNRFRLFRQTASPPKVTKAPVPSAPAAMSHAKAASTKPSEANVSPVSSAAEAPADTVKTAGSPAAASEVGGIAAVLVSSNPAEPDALVGSALSDSLSIDMKAANGFLAPGQILHLEVCMHRASVVAQGSLHLPGSSLQHLPSFVNTELALVVFDSSQLLGKQKMCPLLPSDVCYKIEVCMF